ncbi:ROK family transcriptional regulator [Actinoplanes sp. RD1]|uniref:ROK family transcriptional regulator n=1 Tax=Actinoplanes sp. RD1 TaxID=3064538 RepID=UPI0027422028|nr:ROK family transcriptional regulator [Actinoplanes sp. RD1]
MTIGRRVHVVSRDFLLAQVREAGAVSRAELVRRTGMARVTVNGLVAELLAAGLLTETGEPVAGGPGRPARLLTLGPAAGCVVGAVVGSAGVRAAVADLTGAILVERDLALDTTDVTASLDAVAGLIRECVAAAGTERGRIWSVVAGFSAPVGAGTGALVASSVLPGWGGVVPGAELERRLGLRVTVRNDADLSLAGEVAHGAARGHRTVCYLRISTGIGCGLLLDGHVHHGATGAAGEIGHVQVDETGTLCRCGNRGCLETIASPREILAMLTATYGEPVTAEQVTELARHDATAERVLADAGRMIGRVVADLANTINPSLVVLDGPLIEPEGTIVAGVRESVRRYAQPEVADATLVRASALEGRAAILGAVSVAVSATPAARGSRAFGATGESAPAGSTPARRERAVRRGMIVDLLRHRGTVGRSDIVRLTRLPRAAVLDLLGELEHDGTVEQAAPAPGERRAGRPSPRFRLAAPPGLLLGLALGADSTRAVLTDGSGTVLHQAGDTVPVGMAGSLHVRRAAELGRELLLAHGHDPAGLRAAGLSVPAPVDPATGRFGSRGVLPMFAGFDPGGEVRDVLGVPVTAENNADLAALAETRRGAGRGARDVLYLRADQYTGAGIIAGGRMHRGAIGYAGEVGHLNVREVGPFCVCGSRGCLSVYLNPAYFAALLDPRAGSTEADLLALAGAPNRPVQRAIADAGRLIGRSVASLCNVLNPAVVVVGGAFAEAGPYVVDGVREALLRHCSPSATAGLTVVPTALGADAELLGAVEILL